jgi:hypothetical protein
LVPEKFLKVTFMTKIRSTSAPKEAELLELLENERRKLDNAKALLAAMRCNKPEVQAKFSEGEVYQATLARHLAQGGHAADELTTEQFLTTIEGFRKVQEAMQGLEEAKDLAKHYTKHVETLKPVLKPRELKTGKITFGRAVLITTGNHTRKDQRPARWIPIFIRRTEEAMKELTLELVGPGRKWLVDSVRHDSKYRGLQADDCLSLEEFAEMHYLNFQWFEQGITTMEALIGAENSRKKSLGRAGGQTAKAPRRKPKKQRTKSV